MKRPLLACLICLCAMTLATSLSLAQTSARPVKTERSARSKTISSNISIVELTNAEMYRYGRELYMRKKFTEAAKVFLKILKHDCGNKIAQYHLRQIAAKAPSLAFLNDKLDKLPCQPHDFSKEDFLPASVYYEKDPNIILEQLISHRIRHRLNEKEMAEKIDSYMTMVRELENSLALLKQDADKARANMSPGGVDPKTLARIEEGKRSAGMIEKEINVLKNQLASERLEQQKAVQDMRTRLAEAEVAIPSVQEDTRPLYAAVAQARTDLEGKERQLADKDQTFMTLQARFEDIQRRLRSIQNNLQETRKP